MKDHDHSKDKKNKNKNKKKNKGGGGLYNPNIQLKGQRLEKIVKQLARSQHRSQIKGARQQKRGLKALMQSQMGANQRLAEQASSNVQGYYRQLAQREAQNAAFQQALSGRLKTGVDQAGAQAQQAIQGTGAASQSALGGTSDQFGNVSGSAKAQLAQRVAEQSSHAAREQQALSAQAGGQGAAYQYLAQAQAQSNMRDGGRNLADISNRAMQNNREIQEGFTQPLIDAQSQISQLRSGRSDARTALLMEMLGREREFGLSKAAIGIDRDAFSEDAALERLKGRQSRKTIGKQQQGNERLAGIKGAESRKTIGKQQGGFGGKGKTKKEKKQDAREFKEAVKKGHAEYDSITEEHPRWGIDKVKRELRRKGYSSAQIRKILKRVKKKNKKPGAGGPKQGQSPDVVLNS